jgi:O-Antigen ligase
MDAASMRRRAPWEYFGKIDWGAVAAWALAFGLIVYLGLEGGGYDPLVHDKAGIAVWWLVLAGVVVGALPRRGVGPLAWTALGLLVAFVAWTALSLVWTESIDRTSAELARVSAYLGIFALALFARGREGARLMVGAVAAAIACVAIVALLSRLHPAWFPEASQTARFLPDGRERLSYPLNYWNALGALIAIGAPLLLHAATSARRMLLGAIAAAVLPAMALTAFLTLSRGGIAAAFVALVIFLALTSDRLPKVLTLLAASAGGAILIAAAASRDAFQHGVVKGAAEQQADQMVPIVLSVCLVVGLLQAAILFGLRREMRPRWTHLSSGQSLVGAVIGALAVVIVAVVLNAPGHASDAWTEFKRGDVPSAGTGRLTSAGGESRYELWSAAVDENAGSPLIGTGSGTYEFWWNRNGGGEVVRDAHSLYLQTLGELGIVGIALLGTFLLLVVIGGGGATLRAPPRGRPQLAAALAGCVAFCFTATFDWMWQVPVLPVAMLLLASVLLTAGREVGAGVAGLRLPLRAAFVVLALIAIAVIATPLATTTLVRQSEADARAGDLPGALEAARSAQNVQPDAATPRLQQALVLEEQGELAPAAKAARAATERESTNWRTWLVLSRIEAERGRAGAAVRTYVKAKSLNPHFSLFAE